MESTEDEQQLARVNSLPIELDLAPTTMSCLSSILSADNSRSTTSSFGEVSNSTTYSFGEISAMLASILVDPNEDLRDCSGAESVRAHQDAVNVVAVSSNWMVYTGSVDRLIQLWAKPFCEARHALVATLEKQKSAVNALALNNDGSVLFSGACDRSILVWEKEDNANHMAVTGALRGHGKAILCLINISMYI